MSLRLQKVSSAIQSISADALNRHRQADNRLITITNVTVSPDLRHAVVHLSFLNVPSDKIPEMLRELTPVLQEAVAHELKSKFTPKLELRLDDSGSYSSEIQQKLKKL